MDMVSKDELLKHIRDGLGHLRDPVRLLKNPLAALLGVADRSDAFSALQAQLLEAIDSLKPGEDERAPSRAWRTYECLYYRYVDGVSQEEVADQLGISVRHLRREQHAAMELLAYRLWHQLAEAEQTHGEATAPTKVPTPDGGLSLNGELGWLRELPPQQPANLDQVLPQALETVRPLADRHQVALVWTAPESQPDLAAHPVALSQTLLTLLSLAVQHCPGGRVTLVAGRQPYEVQVRISAEGSSVPSDSPADKDGIKEDMARQLAALSGCQLLLGGDPDAFEATLVVPILERLPVLAIDDNADTLQLLQRYCAGTRYHLVSTQDPEQALALAEEVSPQAIVLDVMMPQVDGWKVLGLLRQHPLTSETPVVVCTILAHEELALSLGAAAFLRKPVSRQSFLEVLDRQLAERQRGSG